MFIIVFFFGGILGMFAGGIFDLGWYSLDILREVHTYTPDKGEAVMIMGLVLSQIVAAILFLIVIVSDF